MHSATLQSVSRFQRGGLTGTFINVHLFLAATTGGEIYVLLRKNSPTWFAYKAICNMFGYIYPGLQFPRVYTLYLGFLFGQLIIVCILGVVS